MEEKRVKLHKPKTYFNLAKNKVNTYRDGNEPWLKFPTTIQIETNNLCGPKHSGINCSYCYPTWNKLCGNDSYAEMDMDTIQYIQKDLSFHMPHLRNKCQDCRYYLDGDPQNESRLPDILKSHNKIVGWLPTLTFSCGTKPQSASLFCDRNLSMACFTLSAPNSEVYKKIHRGNKFVEVMQTLHYVNEHRHHHQRIEVHYVITKDNIGYMKEWYDLIGSEFPDFKRVFSPLVVNKFTVPSQQALGDLTLQIQEDAILKIDPNAFQFRHDNASMGWGWPCVLWGDVSINVHGDLLECCCWGAEKSLMYGNIKDYIREGKSIKDYWDLKTMNLQDNEICNACNLKHPDVIDRLNKIKHSCEVKT
jgi:hypothetical protein